ncbi:unnamed protein product [Prunus armeniaca]
MESFFEHCVPDIRSQATSLIFIADRLLHEAQTQWSLFSSIVSLTYARGRQASSPLQTGCFTKHKLNGVFFEHCVPDIRSQATSLIFIVDRLLHEAQTQWRLFFEHCVPDIRSQATSLISIADGLLHEAQTQWSLFSSIVSLTYARR